jgi:multiple sugar transport system permease protein
MKELRQPAVVIRVMALVLIVVIAVFPVYWMLNTALSEDSELYGTGQDWYPHLERVSKVPDFLGTIPILGWLGNSAMIALGTTTLSLLVAVHAAYALSRYRFVGKGIAGVLLFATQMMPQALILVPLFALFSALGLLNGLYGLVLANTAFVMPVAVFILKGAIDSISYEIEEAARVDGVSRFGVLSLVVLPLIAPSVAAAAVICFFDGWNEFLFANTFLRDQALWPASVGLSSFIGQFYTPLNGVMISAFAFGLPAVAFFLLMQRRIVSGLTAGSVKG